MKNKFFSFVFLAVFYLPVFSQSIVSVKDVKQWMEQRFAKGVVPPFSFVYEGKKSDSFIRDWQYQSKKIASAEQNQETYVYSYSDKTTGLVVKCTVTCFTDFPAIEWVLNFSNTSGKNTPLIEKVAAVDHSFFSVKKGDFTLHHLRGCTTVPEDFHPYEDLMQVGKNIYLATENGRSSDGPSTPFFNIEMPGQGIVVAVGWTGAWYADFVQTDAKTVTLKSGMEKMQLALYPQEEIRTPKICLLFWKGEDRMIGHNQFRQLMLAHHSRKIDGRFAEYPLSEELVFGFWGRRESITEGYCTGIVKAYKQYNIMPEAFWIDAGWSEGCNWDKGEWYEGVGSYTPHKERFPNGLRPVADVIHEAGGKFLVWFEIERVQPQTEFGQLNPEWLLKGQGWQIPFLGETYLFDLGNRDARIWLTDYVTDFLKKEGIDIYRQDFALFPNHYWAAKDQPGRIGMSEIRHIEGLYAFWDSLLVRFPNLLIDNCASGGRRIDLETMSRSAPLLRSDYAGDPIGKQCQTYGLNFYLPIHASQYVKVNDYDFHSTLSAAVMGSFFVGGQKSVEVYRRYMDEFKLLRPYFYGDYYPLTSIKNFTSSAVWLAYQMNRPAEKDGIIVAFRRENSEDVSIRIKPSGLEKNAVYELDYGNGTQTRQKGNELMDGFEITIPTKPASLLIKYKQVIKH